MRRKHVPQRTCIACREARAKRDLVRLVRTPEGALVIDETGRRNGRGAYLCRQRTCWETALKRGQVGRALKMEIGEQEKDMLRAHMDVL
ncbi:MAG TPA: YlxR family protein [Anaerolineae bacterium]|nr:YlxR family protein [Anaerolineae bacterium]